MWTRLCTTAAVIAAVACIDDGVDGTPGSLRTDESASDPGPNAVTRLREPMADDHPECALLPADDSACAHACDPAALAAYVPKGTCATFACTLINGETYLVGGCN